MCWCLRVYWTVLNNLFARFFDNLTNKFHNDNNDCYYRSCYCCCCRRCCSKHKQIENPDEAGSDRLNGFDLLEANVSTSVLNHDYVIVDDIDANYVEIERRKIETEPYYLIVDRRHTEDILASREDGACLVRPYKEADISIKYIVSIYAQQQYFHLFIRQIAGKELYGIGQAKPNERLFNTPSDIIDFYRYNALLCTNKMTSISLVLKPIVI